MPTEEVESTETRRMVEEKCKRFSRKEIFFPSSFLITEV